MVYALGLFPNQAEEFVNQRLIAFENATLCKRCGRSARLAHTAHRHAHVLALDHDDSAFRAQIVHERVGDL